MRLSDGVDWLSAKSGFLVLGSAMARFNIVILFLLFFLYHG